MPKILSQRSANDANRPVPKKRPRTRSGCLTCRIRRIKCDEARPSCVKCTSTGRKCDGYAPQPLSKKELAIALGKQSQQTPFSKRQTSASLIHPPQPPLLSEALDETERQCLDFFRSDTASISGVFFCPGFWQSIVLQVSHIEPAIKHGLIALGSLHKRFQLETAEGTTCPNRCQEIHERSQYAMVHYGKAVGYAKKLLADVEAAHNRQEEAKNIDIAFIACIIFVCYENLAGNYETSTMHLRSGLRVLEEHERQRNALKDVNVIADKSGACDSAGARKTSNPNTLPILPAPSPIRPTICRLLRRLEVQCLALSGMREIYMYGGKYPPFSQEEYAEPQPVPPDFMEGGMQEASSYLIDIIRWLFKLGAFLQVLKGPFSEYMQEDEESSGVPATRYPTEADSGHIFYLLQRCEQHLQDWNTAYQRTLPCLSTHPSCVEHRTSAVLHIYYICAILIVQAGKTGTETAWDNFLPTIRDTIDTVEKLIVCRKSDEYYEQNGSEAFLVSLEIGVIIPLFFLGHRCRDPVIRQRIISLLSSPPFMRESRWDSLGAAAVIRRIMEIEESEARRLHGQLHSPPYTDSTLPPDADCGINESATMEYPVLSSAEDIPEQARVRAILPGLKAVDRVVEVEFAMKPDGKQWVVRRERISF
ncbi:hypothetical protein AJ79_07539 [Helicocarpus griseus UAMH5409]|uniref:Zn(2)-C6 fungal-type domain-containing protein n=1 Tax=Helicocarpus griseus UAMH5409 TaxID=1447875 RepID=A0A2B7WTS3_9EURO|nr:hypothetical protein AJ79_07539 [Helicocarpus griseus UAMH5409]